MVPFKPILSDPLYTTLKIVRILPEVEDVASFELEPQGKSVHWTPGQFITMAWRESDREYRRSYSISSRPGQPLRITIKRVPNGNFSRPMLESAAVGDLLTMAGPAAGFFTLAPVPPTSRVFFLAAGSGISPILPMLYEALESFRRPVLFYSNRSAEDTIFRKEILEMQRTAGLGVEWLFSNHQNLRRARLGKEVLLELLHQYGGGEDLTRHWFFLCGPHDYMVMASIVLANLGVPADQIRQEQFTPVRRPEPSRPPDTLPHHVTVRYNGRDTSFVSAYPNTILQSARREGISLPYSCEAGRCGSCVAQCRSGQTWMQYNEVLTDREVAAGRVLVCQAFPVEGDVEIDYDNDPLPGGRPG